MRKGVRDRMKHYDFLPGITLVQIPRVLYDLLGLIYFVETRTSINRWRN